MKKEEIKINILTLVVAAVSLFLYSQFPAEDSFQKIMVSIFFLLILPALYCKVTLKKKIKKLGFTKGEWKEGVGWSFVLLVLAGGIIFLLFNYSPFLSNYYLPEMVKIGFGWFIFYEFFLVGIFLFLYEFFFRGFLMLGFLGQLKYKGILLQFIVFVIFLLILGNLNWIMVPYIITAPLAGIIAYRSRSILYSFIFNLSIIFLIDTLFIKMIN